MLGIIQAVIAHLIVDHISRQIDKKEAAKEAAAKAQAVVGDIGDTRRARLRRAALREQMLGDLLKEAST